MLRWIKIAGASVREVREERLGPALAPDDIRQDMRFLQIQNHYSGGAAYTMRKGRPRLLVRRFAMYHHRVATAAQLRTALPDLLDKRTGSVVGIGVNATGGQHFLNLQRRTKGWHDHNVC